MNNSDRSTSIIVNDKFREFAMRIATVAQDTNPNNLVNIRIMTEYSYYHRELANFCKVNNYGNIPKPCDNLHFVALLSYPIAFISSFESFEQLNIYFRAGAGCDLYNLRAHHGESDFEFIRLDENGDEARTARVTCICNQPLQNVYVFENKMTCISFQIGCECNITYGIINHEAKEFKEKLKGFKEHNKEVRKNLPPGHYEKLRQQRKLEKEQLREEKDLEKKLKKLTKTSPYNKYDIVSCHVCNERDVCTKTYNLWLCQVCVSEEQITAQHCEKRQTMLKITLGREYLYNCDNCDAIISNVLGGATKHLCRRCVKSHKIYNCNRCYDSVLVKIENKYKYCSECDEVLIASCKDCRDGIFINDEMKDGLCEECYDKPIVNECSSCDKEFVVSRQEYWKTQCKQCYREMKRHETKQSYTPEMHECELCSTPYVRDAEWKTKCYPCATKKSKPTFRNL